MASVLFGRRDLALQGDERGGDVEVLHLVFEGKLLDGEVDGGLVLGDGLGYLLALRLSTVSR